MSKTIKKLIIFVVVISTILTVGGVVYTSLLGVENSRYTKTMGTITEIETDVEEGETPKYSIKSATVTYDTADGPKTNKLTGVLQLPPRVAIGTEIDVRYNNENPNVVKSEMIDWFPAVMLLILGVLYAVGGALVIVFKKKAGHYAIIEQSNDPIPLEDDDFSLVDQLEKLSQEELDNQTPSQDNQ